MVATLGTGDDEQFVDTLEGTRKVNFMLHYNFAPYSVGEAGRMGFAGPPRNRPRQARLARHQPDAAPRPKSSPTRIRVVSEITESNGSSSMATVLRHLAGADGCGRSDEEAGGAVSPWALILEGDRYARALRHPG